MAARQAKSLAELRWVMYCHKCHWVQSIDSWMKTCQCGNMAAQLSDDLGVRRVKVIANCKELARVMELTTLLAKHFAVIQKPGDLPGVVWCLEKQRAIDEGWKLVEDFVKPRPSRKIPSLQTSPERKKELTRRGKPGTDALKARKMSRKVATFERSKEPRFQSSAGNLRAHYDRSGAQTD